MEYVFWTGHNNTRKVIFGPNIKNPSSIYPKLMLSLVALLLPAVSEGLSGPSRLRSLLASRQISLMPCCYDGLTARLVENAGFNVTFMTGFGVSASRGFPDVQLISYGQMLDSARTIVASLRDIPCIADGDTGYGNAVNVKRTVAGYSQVGMSGVMIEDQVSPKRCGHTRVKEVVEFQEAVSRVRAACDARDEIEARIGLGEGPVIVARTDANAVLGLDEAIKRCRAFRDVGADVTFLEAPKNLEEMETYADLVDGPKLANMLEGGKTPILSPDHLERLGYSLAAYPVTLLSAMTIAANEALDDIKRGREARKLTPFPSLCTQVGFDEYWLEDAKYSSSSRDD